MVGRYRGCIVLLVAATRPVVGAWQDWTINSVAIGAPFAISLVLLLLGVTGRLPATVSVSDKGFALGYLAGVEDTAQKAAEVNQKALAAARSLPEQPAPYRRPWSTRRTRIKPGTPSRRRSCSEWSAACQPTPRNSYRTLPFRLAG
jgi:hypothetical protein